MDLFITLVSKNHHIIDKNIFFLNFSKVLMLLLKFILQPFNKLACMLKGLLIAALGPQNFLSGIKTISPYI